MRIIQFDVLTRSPIRCSSPCSSVRRDIIPYMTKKLRRGSAFCRSVSEFLFYAMPKSFSWKGRSVSSLAIESVRGVFSAMIAATIGGAGRVGRRKRRTQDTFTLRAAASASGEWSIQSQRFTPNSLKYSTTFCIS